MNPSQWLHILKVGMLWHLMRESNILVGTYLRHQHNAANFLDIRIIRWTHSVEIASYLNPQVTDANEALQNILG